MEYPTVQYCKIMKLKLYFINSLKFDLIIQLLLVNFYIHDK